METLNWINKVIESGNLCKDYCGKVADAKSKKQLADIALDYNGASFLCEMTDKGMPLRYDVLVKEFNPFINGKYVAVNESNSGTNYTVALWCQHNEYEVEVSTTVATFLDCQLDVVIPKNHYAILFVDTNCKLRVFCMENAICKVYYWGDAVIENPKDNKNITIRKRNG